MEILVQNILLHRLAKPMLIVLLFQQASTH